MQIETAIIQALKNIGMPEDIIPILADRDGVEPRAPHLLINIINTSNIGLAVKSTSHTPNNVVELVRQVKDINISLTFHASTKGNTHDWVQYLDTGLQSDLLDWAFTQQGLSLVSSDGIMYQPQPIAGKNYKNAIMNLLLRAEFADEYKVNGIDMIRYVGNIGNSQDIVVDIDPAILYISK